MLSSLTGLEVSYNYTYDTQSRLASKTENIGGVNYIHNYEYDDGTSQISLPRYAEHSAEMDYFALELESNVILTDNIF